MQTNNEETAPLAYHTPLKAYASRWYILAIFTIFCIMQNSMWGFFPPIQAPLEQLYGWSDAFVEVVSMLSMVCNGVAGTLETLVPPVLAALWYVGGTFLVAFWYLGVAYLHES